MSGDDRCARLGSLVDQIRIRMGMPEEIFAGAVRPVIVAYREYDRACAASSVCHRDAPLCPLLQQLTVAGVALDYRRGRILPPNTAPEDIGERVHRWTYAVFVAALLYPRWKLPGVSVRTAHTSGVQGTDGDYIQPMAVTSGCKDDSTCDALSLFRRIVPHAIQRWLAADQTLLSELQGLLSGDAAARTGAIGLLVTRAAADFSGAEVKVPAVCAARGVRVAVVQNSPVLVSNATPAANASSAADSAGREIAANAAHRFMQWVSGGIKDGSLRVNQVDALVHFVPEGMLLVSPRIFKVFARQFGEDGTGGISTAPADESRLGLVIQRQLLRAGWHRMAANGINMHRFEVLRHGKPVSTLSGILIGLPERFLDAVPPTNPALGRRVPP